MSNTSQWKASLDCIEEAAAYTTISTGSNTKIRVPISIKAKNSVSDNNEEQPQVYSPKPSQDSSVAKKPPPMIPSPKSQSKESVDLLKKSAAFTTISTDSDKALSVPSSQAAVSISYKNREQIVVHPSKPKVAKKSTPTKKLLVAVQETSVSIKVDVTKPKKTEGRPPKRNWECIAKPPKIPCPKPATHKLKTCTQDHCDLIALTRFKTPCNRLCPITTCFHRSIDELCESCGVAQKWIKRGVSLHVITVTEPVKPCDPSKGKIVETPSKLVNLSCIPASAHRPHKHFGKFPQGRRKSLAQTGGAVKISIRESESLTILRRKPQTTASKLNRERSKGSTSKTGSTGVVLRAKSLPPKGISQKLKKVKSTTSKSASSLGIRKSRVDVSQSKQRPQARSVPSKHSRSSAGLGKRKARSVPSTKSFKKSMSKSPTRRKSLPRASMSFAGVSGVRLNCRSLLKTGGVSSVQMSGPSMQIALQTPSKHQAPQFTQRKRSSQNTVARRSSHKRSLKPSHIRNRRTVTSALSLSPASSTLLNGATSAENLDLQGGGVRNIGGVSGVRRLLKPTPVKAQGSPLSRRKSSTQNAARRRSSSKRSLAKSPSRNRLSGSNSALSLEPELPGHFDVQSGGLSHLEIVLKPSKSARKVRRAKKEKSKSRNKSI